MAIERSDHDVLLTVPEVAERLRVHPITVRRHIKAGRLRAVRIGRAVRVREADLAVLLRQDHDASPSADSERRRRAARQLLALRESMGVYQTDTPSPLVTSEELIRQERRMLARKHDRWRKPFDEMRKLRDQMKPMDISTADLVRLARSAREWMHNDDEE